MDNPIVFFDGFCNLCNASVDFLVKHDQYGQLRYAPLQGKTAAQLLASQLTQLPDSVILYEHGKIYTRSTAVLRLLSYLPWPWQLLKIGYVIPCFLRDYIYDFIARKRYNCFGKKESCRFPTPQEKGLFLE